MERIPLQGQGALGRTPGCCPSVPAAGCGVAAAPSLTHRAGLLAQPVRSPGLQSSAEDTPPLLGCWTELLLRPETSSVQSRDTEGEMQTVRASLVPIWGTWILQSGKERGKEIRGRCVCVCSMDFRDLSDLTLDVKAEGPKLKFLTPKF